MSKLSLCAIGLAAGLFAAQSAMAVPFDPNLYLPFHQVINDDSTPFTVEIKNYGFDTSVLGTYRFLEEGASGVVNDSVIVANSGLSGWGVLTFDSSDTSRPTQGVVCLDGEPVTPGTLPVLCLDLPLALGNGLDLGVTLASVAGDGPLSDTIDIAVPEPASLAVLGVGLAALGVARRRHG